jgi:hypothetical protein
MKETNLLLEEDWSVLTRFLPTGWQQKARDLKALQRHRRFSDAGKLLRTLLIHLVEDCSSRETVVRARQGDIATISDVAFLKRLRLAGEWLRWMASGVMARWIGTSPMKVKIGNLRIRIVDATHVQEPGSKAPSLRIHYAVELHSLLCDEVNVTHRDVGESFKNFTVRPGDLLLADRGYAHASGIAAVIGQGGHVLVRTSLSLLSLRYEDGTRLPLLENLRRLKDGEIGDWDVWVANKNQLIKGRICAIRKGHAAREKARRRVLRQRNKIYGTKGQLRPETLEASDYIFVFTTLDRTFSAEQVLEVYRVRWQIELVFKRLKSILGLGRLHKINPDNAKSWLHGKLLIAFLIESIILAARRFSPWGFPTSCTASNKPLPLARNVVSALHPETCYPSLSQNRAVHGILEHNSEPAQGTTPKTNKPNGQSINVIKH